jgi:hypothetical protein
MNSHYASEVLAYQASIAAAKALGLDKISLGRGKSAVTIWESGWGNSDNKKHCRILINIWLFLKLMTDMVWTK